MPGFGLTAPRQTLFGRGVRDKAATAVAAQGRRVLLLRSGSVVWGDHLAEQLHRLGVTVLSLPTRGEPDLPGLRAAMQTARGFDPDCVTAVGGGAVIDLGKALAALLPSGQDPLVHLEIVGQGRPLGADPLPFMAIPSTAGTGAEATRNAVIAIPDKAMKVSLRDARMVPALALVDPALCDGLPRDVTLATGLDAVTQLIEAYLCNRANPITDALCRDGIPAGLAALHRLMMGEDPAARDALARASHLSGLALANAGLGVVHGLAAVIGGRGGAHGAICGRLLPAALSVNRQAAAEAGMDDSRFAEVDGWLRAALDPAAQDGTQALRRFIAAHGLPTLAALHCPPEAHAAIAGAALNASSTRANPVPLSAERIQTILTASDAPSP